VNDRPVQPLASGDTLYGILAPDAEIARRYADYGRRFIGIGSDATAYHTRRT
jgi:2-keto-3-deoxy-L-rhamnonate aldolase RhmA